jgi:hypothetical protein
MQAVMKVWAKTTLREREAFHQFSCQNSRDPEVLRIIQPYTSAKVTKREDGSLFHCHIRRLLHGLGVCIRAWQQWDWLDSLCPSCYPPLALDTGAHFAFMKVEFVQVNKPVTLNEGTDLYIKAEPDAEIKLDHDNGKDITVRVFFRGTPGLLKIVVGSWEEFNALCIEGAKWELEPSRKMSA